MIKKIVAISDTHGYHRSFEIPSGDILVHAGDITGMGSLEQVKDLNDFLGSQPHKHKIVIAGNHDFCFERNPEASRAALSNCIYLQDESVRIEGIHFYGSPWQPWFFDWAFNLYRGPAIKAKWDQIPDDTEILLTHAAPFSIRDKTFRGQNVGCRDLLDTVNRIQPKIHIFGHIHEGAGISSTRITAFLNASICDVSYQPVNPPLLYEYKI